MIHLLHPAYIPNIATFAVIAQNEVRWEVWDNFQKQTYRNRAYICTDRGKLMLNIPIQHVGKNQGRQLYKDVKIENEYKWQRQHWRALQTAYRTSPYFEFYEDEIAPLYTKEYDYLLDYNLKSIEIISNCLQINMPNLKTGKFELNPKTVSDDRFLVEAKKRLDFVQPEYVQVFGDRHGFIENMSVLDLLFNEGTNALSYLKALNIKPLNV
ncbi:WbqC family protein [Maribacter algarum]|uniref:WbqC family protein n=1 Tax=Maribacter algarum (ex Zhang et al. 2020) TaxID=2578118 RepID=A0A5S3PHW5_9FLAO|nr:WbqC family protein [Maribacter algarum]TMM53849.1 WbqC family protein [Maribacter algarum]